MTDDITLDAPETRIERFLAAAAGVEGITLDEPETRIERYLYMIAQGSGGVPAVEDADKGKYLHANESTGDLEWATAGGSGGGVLVVTDTGGTLDKTWQEIHDGGFGIVVADYESKISYLPIQTVDSVPFRNSYNVYVLCYGDDGAYLGQYKASSASGYPTYTAE